MSDDAAEQAEQVMRNLETVLREAGTSFDRVVAARIFLVDFEAYYPTVNRIYASRFEEGRYPARTTVGVTHLALGALVAVHASAGREAVLLLIATVAVSDTAQYYTGRMLGRTPLAPRHKRSFPKRFRFFLSKT